MLMLCLYDTQPGSKLSKDFAELNSIGAHSVSEGLTKDDYNALYTQWHQKLGIAAIGCLKSPEYMYTRSALILLSRIVLVFPTQPKMGEKILKALTPLQSDDNPRPDIRATAQGYSSQLLKARDEGMWKEENIAVTKARQEKEKQKQEERKKKLAQQHEEMKKESEMISRQISEDNWRRDGGRDNRGRGGQWGMDSRMHPRVSLSESISIFYLFLILRMAKILTTYVIRLDLGTRPTTTAATASAKCKRTQIHSGSRGGSERFELFRSEKGHT